MRKNIIIEFEPKSSYRDWIFNKVIDKNKKTLDFFSKKQIEELVEDILKRIPQRLLDVLEKLDWKIIITNTRNLEEECSSNIKIYGYTNFEKKEIKVYATKEGIRESLPHELAHFLDSLINITNTYEWKKIYEEEKECFRLMSNYYTSINHFSECFTDSFMLFVIDNFQLKKYAPKTYSVIENIFEYIEYIIDEDFIKNLKENELKKDKELLSALEISCFKEDINYW